MSIINKVTGGFPNITNYDPVTGEIIDIIVPGNVTANSFVGDGGFLSNIQYANLVGSYSNSNVASYLPTYTGDFTADNANIANDVVAAHFIGDGSNLSNLNASNLVGAYSNANVAAYLPTANVAILGTTITGSLFSGDGGELSNIQYANLVGAYSNSNVAAYLPTANVAILGTTITGSLFSGDGGELSNITGGNIVGAINISPNNLTAGNATFNGNVGVVGNLTVSGNLNYQDVTDLVVGDPLIYIGANNTADLVDLGIVASYDPGAGELHTGFVRDHTDGTWKLFTDLVAEPTTVIDWANATLGTLEVGTVIGDGGFLSNIQYANLVGAYSNANVAHYLPTANVAILGTTITGTLFSGDGGQLSNIIAANIVGAYSNSNVGAYLPTANVDILGDVVTATLFSGNGSALTNLPYDTAIVNGTSNVSIPVANGSITFAVAGVKVGTLNQQNNINFGDDAGFSGQSADAIAIGAYAGRLNQGTSAVSLGSTAGNDSQGENAVAIGIFAGSNEQGAEAVAIGDGAGNYQQGTQAVAIGFGAGNFTQLADAIAIGTAAGQSDQGANAIAIGQNAGQNSQGANAIAIGLNAGTTQAADSIIINATGNVLDTTDSGLYIDPVRNDVSNVANVVYYNTDTKELTYAPAAELYGNANVEAYLPTANVAILGTTITGSLFSGDGGELSNIQYANLVGAYSNSNVTAYLPINTANIGANNITATGTVTTPTTRIGSGQQGGSLTSNASTLILSSTSTTDGSQAANVLIKMGAISGGEVPTYVGNVTIETVSGAAVKGNINIGKDGSKVYLGQSGSFGQPVIVGSQLEASAGANGLWFKGDGGNLSNIQYANLVGAYSNSNVAAYLPTANVAILGTTITGSLFSGDGGELSNITGGNIVGSINIGSGTITAANATFNGDVSVSGNVDVTGNLNYHNVTDLVVGDPLIYLAANNTADLVDIGFVGGYNDGNGQLYTGFVRDHVGGTWKLFSGLSPEPTTVVDWANATLTSLEAGSFTGDGGFLSNIQAANLVGAYSNANVADYLPLANVDILGTTITGSLFSGDGGELSNIQFGNLIGANANIAAYLPTYTGNLSPSNLSVTELSDFGAIGNITISGGSSGQFLTTDGTGNLSFGDPISAVPAIYFTANANANNQTFSNIYLSAFGANTDITLFYNGALLENTYYSLSGSTLTVNTPLKVNDSICISQQFVSNANPVTMIPRSNDVITAATITPNVEYADQYDVLALAEALTVAAPTGVAQNAQRLTIRIKDNGVSQTLSWNAIYREIGTSLPGATVAGKLLYVGCIYNSQDTTWDVVSVAIQA